MDRIYIICEWNGIWSIGNKLEGKKTQHKVSSKVSKKPTLGNLERILGFKGT